MPYTTTVSPPTEGGASSPPQVYKCRWLTSSTLEVEEDMKKILLMELPLVLLSLVLLSLTTCVLGQGTDTCDPCDCSSSNPNSDPSLSSEECGHIRFTDPSRNPSAGQIQVCHNSNWQTICGEPDSQRQYGFSDADANVACFQLGFIGGNASKHRGLACETEYSQSRLVVDPPCKGWEEQIYNFKKSHCSLKPELTGCSHRTAVNVSCEREPLVKYVCTYVASIASG